MIRKALPKFTKILSHKYLEPYGISETNYWYTSIHLKCVALKLASSNFNYKFKMKSNNDIKAVSQSEY